MIAVLRKNRTFLELNGTRIQINLDMIKNSILRCVFSASLVRLSEGVTLKLKTK